MGEGLVGGWGALYAQPSDEEAEGEPRPSDPQPGCPCPARAQEGPTASCTDQQAPASLTAQLGSSPKAGPHPFPAHGHREYSGFQNKAPERGGTRGPSPRLCDVGGQAQKGTGSCQANRPRPTWGPLKLALPKPCPPLALTECVCLWTVWEAPQGESQLMGGRGGGAACSFSFFPSENGCREKASLQDLGERGCRKGGVGGG